MSTNTSRVLYQRYVHQTSFGLQGGVSKNQAVVPAPRVSLPYPPPISSRLAITRQAAHLQKTMRSPITSNQASTTAPPIPIHRRQILLSKSRTLSRFGEVIEFGKTIPDVPSTVDPTYKNERQEGVIMFLS